MNVNKFWKKPLVLLVACSAIFFESLDVSIVNLSLQSISHSIHIRLATTQWIQTVYLIAFGSLLLLGGRLCDYWGNKIIFIFGLAIFGLASLSAAVCGNLFFLLLIRASQGFGAAMAMPAAISILSSTFDEGLERNKAFGIFGASAAIGFALGLALGGIITTYFNWHWIFSMSFPIILLVILISIRVLPNTSKQAESSFNFLSTVLLTLSLILLCYGIHNLAISGWYNLCFILLGILGLIIMLKYDRKNPNPFFINAAFKNTISMQGQLSSFILGTCFLSFVFVSTLLLANNFGFSSTSIGFTLLPFSLLSALVSKYILPVLFKRFGEKTVVVIAMSSLFVGAILLMVVAIENIFSVLLIAIFLVNSFCIAIGFPAITILALTGINLKNQGTAAGLQSSLYTIGSSIGISFIGLFLTYGVENNYLFSILYSCSFMLVLSIVAVIVLVLRASPCALPRKT
ncbi:MAG: MFS transporter [Chitinophagaceae bacterium]|nr:MFS transporter [Chitinophagaceae bacterium]